MKNWILVKANDIQEGQFFVKRTAGANGFAYLRISDSSAKTFGLNIINTIYGVCYNGNMSAISRDKMVWCVPPSQMNNNRSKELEWEQLVGIKESSPYLKE